MGEISQAACDEMLREGKRENMQERERQQEGGGQANEGETERPRSVGVFYWCHERRNQ